MIILSGYFLFYLEWSHSLKDKRALKQRLQSRLVQEFSLSLMEDPAKSESLTNLGLAYAMVCSDRGKGVHFAQKIEEKALSLTDAQLLAHEYEFIDTLS